MKVRPKSRDLRGPRSCIAWWIHDSSRIIANPWRCSRAWKPPMFGVPEVTWIYVDGSELRLYNQLTWFKYPSLFTGFYISQGVVWDFWTINSIIEYFLIQKDVTITSIRRILDENPKIELVCWFKDHSMVNCSRTFSISEDDRMRIIHYKGATKGFELLTCAF